MTAIAVPNTLNSPQNGHTIDNTAPTVASIALTGSGPYKVGGVITVRVTFSEAVAIRTSGNRFPYVPLRVGAVDAIATTTASSTAKTTYDFSYTVVAGDNDSDGISVAAISTLIMSRNAGVTDAAGNNLTATALPDNLSSNQSDHKVDTVAPAVTINAPPTVRNITGGSYNITVTFGEPVTGFAAADITIGGTASYKPTVGTPVQVTTGAAANRSYTVPIMRASTANTLDQTITYTIAANAVMDSAGNSNSETMARSILKAAPTVTVTRRIATALTNAAYPVTITFSETVSGFVVGDISVSNGTAANFSGSGANYTATITPTADGTVTVSIAAGVATGVDSQQPNLASAALSTTYDGTPPTVTITAPNDTDGAFTATFAFSEPITGFEMSDVQLSNGSVSNFSGSAARYTATITPAANAQQVRITVPNAAAHDAAGNASVAKELLVSLLRLESAKRQQAAHRSILPDVTQAVVGNISNAVSGRIETAVSAAATASLNIGGNNFDLAGLKAGGVQHFMGRTLPQLIANNEQALQTGKLDAKQLLAGTNFALPLAAQAADGELNTGMSSLTFWGGGSYLNVESDGSHSVDWNGDVVSTNIGVDMRPSASLLTGIALSWSEAKLDYMDKAVNTKGRYEYELMTLSPYLGWSASETINVWVAAGFGNGEVNLFNGENGRRINGSDISVQNLSGGLKVQLFSNNIGKLSLLSDVSHSQTELDNDGSGGSLDVDNQRARLSVQAEQTQQLNLDSGTTGTFTPSAQLGVRYDGGDGNTGTGIEAGAGMTLAFSNGLNISFKTRGLLQSSADYRDLELSGVVRYQPRSKHGWSFSFEPRYGGVISSGGIEQLWEQGVQTPEESAASEASLSWRSDLGYSFVPRHGRQWTYYGGMEAELNSSQVHIGSRLRWTKAIQLELEVRRRNDEQRNNAEGEFLLRGRFSF